MDEQNSTEKKVTYLIRAIPESMRRNLKANSAMKGVSMQDLILQIIGDYLDSEK